MTKNNWLMISYIAFLFLSTIVRSFMDFPMWETLVIAVTISGGFLTYSECYESSYDFLKKSNEKTEQWLDKFRATTNSEIKTCEEMIASIEDSHIETDYYLGLIEHIKIISDDLKARFDNDEIARHRKRQRKTEKIYYVVSVVLSIIGFLLFFCILVFRPVEAFFAKSQSSYTVLAFAVMLSSQFSRSYADNKTALAEKDITDKYKEYEAQREEFVSLKDALIIGLKAEAETHAD